MRKVFKKRIAMALLGLAAIAASPVTLAEMMTFNISWAEQSGPATAFGSLTMDTDLIQTNGFSSGIISINNIQSLSMTIHDSLGATTTFGKSDFSDLLFYSFGSLDFSKQLIGQQQANSFLTFGNTDPSGMGGGFGMYGSSATAPSIVLPSQMITNSGDLLYVASMTAMPAVSAVPEPDVFLPMLAGLGMVGFAARRRSKTKAPA